MAQAPALTLLHLGPGLANGLANLHNAYRARTPIVSLIGEHATFHRTNNPTKLAPDGARWTDVCVPISQLSACIDATKRDIAALSFPAIVLGHIGDGNFHVVLLLDPASQTEAAAAGRFNDALIARAIAMDGTCTGEHGVDLGKRESLRKELGGAVDLMADIKRALDPQTLMNPEKIFMTSTMAPTPGHDYAARSTVGYASVPSSSR